MNDPKRLLDQGQGDLGTLLLRSARTLDPEVARERKAALLGAAAGLAATTAVAKASKGLIPLLSSKSTTIGLMTAAIAVGVAARAVSPSPAEPDKALLAAPPPAAVTAASCAAPPDDAPPAAEPTEAAGVAQASPETAPAAAVNVISVDALPNAKRAQTPADPAAPSIPRGRALPAPVVASAGAEPQAPGLAEEVLALKEVRSAVSAGQSQRALTELDAYGQRFPRGRLGLEAEVLRITALAQRGDARTAAARAKTFLAAHPTSPYAHLVRAFARSAGDEPPNPNDDR